MTRPFQPTLLPILAFKTGQLFNSMLVIPASPLLRHDEL